MDGSLHAWTYAASAAYTLDNLAAPVAKRKREAAAAEAAEKQRRLEEGEEEEEAAGEEEGEGDAARRKSGRRASTSSGTAAGEEEQAEEGGRGAEEATKEARPFPYLAGAQEGLTTANPRSLEDRHRRQPYTEPLHPSPQHCLQAHPAVPTTAP